MMTMQRVNPTADDILALLEPGPQTAPTLAAWLDVSVRDVTKLLENMRHAELVKVVGEWTQRRWALAEWQPPAMPVKPRPVPGEPGWWAAHADPALPRASFVTAARTRDTEMQADREWTRRRQAYDKDLDS